MEQRAVRGIFLESGRSRDIKMILKARGLQKDCGGTHGLEAGIESGGKRPHREAKFVLRADFFRGGAHRLQAAPYHQGPRRDCNGQANRNCHTHEDEGRLLHESFLAGIGNYKLRTRRCKSESKAWTKRRSQRWRRFRETDLVWGCIQRRTLYLCGHGKGTTAASKQFGMDISFAHIPCVGSRIREPNGVSLRCWRLL